MNCWSYLLVELSLVSKALKADAANPGVNNLEQEIWKLKTLRTVGVPPEAFRSIPWKVLQMLKRRAWN